jgi:peptide/nickel transport system permease protein
VDRENGQRTAPSDLVLGVLIALPIGISLAYRQYSWLDQRGTFIFIAMIGFSVPTFATGLVLILVFAGNLHWFTSVNDTSLRVTDWASFVTQAKRWPYQ